MIQKNRHKTRGKELLLLLKKYGPLTFDTLLQMVSPPMKKRRLYESLETLAEKALVEVSDKELRRRFYSVPQSLEKRLRIAKMLNCSVTELLQPKFRRQDWLHNDLCSLWIHHLSSKFPDAVIIREHQAINHSIGSEILGAKGTKDDLLPDILMLFPENDGNSRVSVAVEIERTRKNNERIVQKLKRYSEKSKISGLLYVCDTERLADTIRLLYKESLTSKSFRIGHYADYFFLFSDAVSAADSPLDRIFNSNATPTSLEHWCMNLRNTKYTLRRNAQFIKQQTSAT